MAAKRNLEKSNIKNLPEGNQEAFNDIVLSTLSRLAIDGAEFSCTREKGFSLNVRNGSLETLTHHADNNFSITVFAKGRTGSASSSDFATDSIIQTINKAYSLSTFAQADAYAGLPDKTLLAFEYPDCDLYHPWRLSIDEAQTMALACEETALKDKRIHTSEGVSLTSVNSDYVIGNTLGFLGQYSITEHSLSCSLVAKKNDAMQRDHDYTIARNKDDLADFKTVALSTAKKTIDRLDARPIKTQTCPVIFEAQMAKSLLRSFINAISGKNLYRKTTFLLEALGETIFPAFIDIYQQPHLLGALGSAPFDNEGVKTKNQYYIKQGELTSYALATYSGKKLGLPSTGNAGGVYNLSITDSGISFEQLIKQMHKGLIVTDLMGQGVNLTTGDYSRGAAGFWVDHGEIQFPVEEITIAGNLKTLFQSIIAIANDTDYRSSIRTGSILLKAMTIAGT